MFYIADRDKKARSGTLTLKHGIVKTPAFMPVATVGSIKGLTHEMIHDTGSEIILGNAYHFMLRDAAYKIQKLGGLHKFMKWNKPILTDSGGFQVMSLSGLRKVTEEGVKFRSHIDGSIHFLTPEESMKIQHALGSDITMIFDECISYPATFKKAKKSMELSFRWAERSKKAFIKRDGHAIFGIVQGGMYEELREKSAKLITDIGFDGYAIGGLAVGEGLEKMLEVLDYTAPFLPEDKPRYVMGIGKPIDILSAVSRGIDMFDCVLPTRNARNGSIYTRMGEVKIRQSKYENADKPLDEKCNCFTCKNYTKAYLHHLYSRKEMLAATLLTIHNLTFYQDMMRSAREAIKNKELDLFISLLQNGSCEWIE